MSYNGSGTFQINTSGQPVVAGTVISATAFNALTADLATGLSTAITKDGQTTTTARIPFAAGISSTLTTDSSSVSTGSIITSGGVGIAKALYVGTTANVASTTDSSSISTGSIVTAGGVGVAKNLYVGVNANVAGTLGVTGVATFSAAPIYSSLTASSAVATDASKGLVSVTNTGTGNNVLATSPTLVTPILGAASATSVTVAAGAVGTPSITTTGDTNTGIFFPAADTIAFAEGGVEAVRIDASGNVGIGTNAPNTRLQVYKAAASAFTGTSPGALLLTDSTNTTNYFTSIDFNTTTSLSVPFARIGMGYTLNGSTLNFGTSNSYASGITNTAMTIDPVGNLLVGKTSEGASVAGGQIRAIGQGAFTASADVPLVINRLTNDGTLVSLQQASVQEGDISVSGTTVSYNGGHLSRYAQTTTAKDESLVKGTVLSNLDAMNVYTDAEGNPVANEQLNKVKVSDVEGDANIAGVFVNWAHDDAHDVDEINMAMTGDMIIRIAQGMTVARGDLLMSAGDGTAKPQGDDIIRSKTVAKVTSTHVTCTYADGSYCVPCVLMAC